MESQAKRMLLQGLELMVSYISDWNLICKRCAHRECVLLACESNPSPSKGELDNYEHSYEFKIDTEKQRQHRNARSKQILQSR